MRTRRVEREKDERKQETIVSACENPKSRTWIKDEVLRVKHMIKLEMLRTFVAVAKAGNIKNAGDVLGRTGSAISMALKQLEDDLGGALFMTDRKSNLTPLGKMVLELAQEQIKAYDRSVEMMRAYAQNRIGKMTMASVPSFAASIMPSLLADFMLEHPQVEIQLFDMNSTRVQAMVENGHVDIGFAGEPENIGAVKFTYLFSDQFKLLCHRNHHLAHASKPLRWEDIERENIIRNDASDRIINPQFRALTARALTRIQNTTSLIAMVKAGIGVSILPSLSTCLMDDEIAILDLADQDLRRNIGIIEKRGRILPPISHAFKSHIIKNARIHYNRLTNMKT